MSRAALCLILLSVVFAAGCDEDHTKVVVEPRADGKFVRTISLWRTNPAESFKTLPPDEKRVAAVAKLYGTRLEPVGEVVKFRGEFREMPPDVLRDKETNHGGYDVWRAGPGWGGYYRERRPGPTDLYARLEKAASGVDRLTEILAEMFRAELPGEAGVDLLTAFLVGPFRADAKEMMFVMATGSHSDLDDDALVSALAMVLQIAEERGYLDAAALPMITNKETGLELLLRMVAEKMERPLDEDLRSKLGFLTDAEKLAAAFEDAAKSVGEVEKSFDPYVEEILHLDLFSGDETLELVVELPPGAEIIHTSGKRAADERRVEWKGKLDGRAVRILHHVSFSVADEDWQRKRFGRVALTKEDLSNYVFWVCGLPERQEGRGDADPGSPRVIRGRRAGSPGPRSRGRM